jgi:hypothetical protein
MKFGTQAAKADVDIVAADAATGSIHKAAPGDWLKVTAVPDSKSASVAKRPVASATSPLPTADAAASSSDAAFMPSIVN